MRRKGDKPWYTWLNFGLEIHVGRRRLGFLVGALDFGTVWGLRLSLVWWEHGWWLPIYKALSGRALLRAVSDELEAGERPKLCSPEATVYYGKRLREQWIGVMRRLYGTYR